MTGRLPERPDFDAIEIAGVETADQRTTLLALIGNLSFAWSNNESLFIYVLMLLLKTDEVAAAVVFTTLNTTRARLELVERLARIRVGDKSVRDDLDRLIGRFNKATRLRNDFSHATYVLDREGNITHTHTMRISETKGRLTFGEPRKVDRARMQQILRAIRDMRDLNRDLWDFLPRLAKAAADPREASRRE
jgi:hypothetical protein